MLRRITRWFWRSASSPPPVAAPPSAIARPAATVPHDVQRQVLHFRAAADPQTPKRTPRPRRMTQLPVERLELFNRRWRTALQRAGVRTAADFLAADAEGLTRQLKMPRKAVSKIVHRQDAVRLAAVLPPLAPRHALLLIAVHRRDLRKLAAESPGRLHRDLTRFALSSAGQSLLRGKGVPALEEVRRWVEAARERCGLRAGT